VPFRVESNEEANGEFSGLPPPIREISTAASPELEAADTPILRGPGGFTEASHPNQRVAPGGLFCIHVGDRWRGAFYREGNHLNFIGFGDRIPAFYDKLARLHQTVVGSPD